MSRFERELLQWLRQHRADVVTGIASTGKLSDEAIESLKTGVAEFKQLFQSGATGTRVNEAPAEALGDDKVSRETVTRHVDSDES